MKATLPGFILATAVAAILPTFCFAADGQVASLKGMAAAERGTQRVVLTPGSAINAQDVVTTGEGSIVRFRMSDDSYFALPANSSLRIDEYSLPRKSDSGTGRAFFSLLKGGFRTVTGLLGKLSRDSYRVVTPVATLGVRGTEYSVYYSPPHTDAVGKPVSNGSLALMVISGSVFVTTVVNGVASTVEVLEGQSLIIEVTLDSSGKAIAASAPAISTDKPAIFLSGSGDASGDVNRVTFEAVFNDEHAIDLPGPGEIIAPGAPGQPGTPGLPKLPVPPRIEPTVSPS